MRVRVLFFGALKDIAGRAEEALEIPAGTTLEGVFALYSQRFETLKERRSSTLFARNQEFARADTVLADNDEALPLAERPHALALLADPDPRRQLAGLAGIDRKSTRLNSSHRALSRMPSSA